MCVCLINNLLTHLELHSLRVEQKYIFIMECFKTKRFSHKCFEYQEVTFIADVCSFMSKKYWENLKNIIFKSEELKVKYSLAL